MILEGVHRFFKNVGGTFKLRAPEKWCESSTMLRTQFWSDLQTSQVFGALRLGRVKLYTFVCKGKRPAGTIRPHGTRFSCPGDEADGNSELPTGKKLIKISKCNCWKQSWPKNLLKFCDYIYVYDKMLNLYALSSFSVWKEFFFGGGGRGDGRW